MVSRIFSTAGSFMSQVGEVLAPQVHTPLEDLRTHWKAIRKFYIDEKDDDIESFQASQLPEHLLAIGEILLEEEAALADTGPCVEFFLQNKIVETLCALAERDSPPGVRKLVLQTLTILIGDLSIPLLPNMSVHRPIRNLIRRLVISGTNSNITSSNVNTSAGTSPTTTASVTLGNNPPRPPSPQIKTRSRSHSSATAATMEKPNSDSEFVGFLETLVKKLNSDEFLIGFFLDELEYTITELVNTYKKLPVPPTQHGSQVDSTSEILSCKARISFCSALSKLTENDVGKLVLQQFEEKFLDTTLGPALLNPYPLI